METKQDAGNCALCPALQREATCSPLPLQCCLAHLFERLWLSRQKEVALHVSRITSLGGRPSGDFCPERGCTGWGVQGGAALQLQSSPAHTASLGTPLTGLTPAPSSSRPAQNESSLPTVHVQCHLYTDLLRGPGIETSAVLLVRTQGHAGHGHGAHAHLSQVASAAVHVHHPERCRARLVRELLRGKGAAPGQAS